MCPSSLVMAERMSGRASSSAVMNGQLSAKNSSRGARVWLAE